MMIVSIIQINLDLQVELVQKAERCRERQIYSERCFEATISGDCEL